jgi:hypothetical protein
MNALRPLSNEAMFNLAPSIFATEPYHAVSDRYSFIPTSEIVNRLITEGWVPTQARESRTTIEDKRGFTKHLVRFARHDQPMIVGNTTPQIVLTNDHAGGGAYLMDAGLFRLVCGNGMTVSMGSFESLRVRHTGDIVGQVIEASYRIINDVPKIAETVENWQQLPVSTEQARAFAAAAIELKYPVKEEVIGETEDGRVIAKRTNTSPIEPSQLLYPRRFQDSTRTAGANLWQTFNVVQENLVKGGVRGRSASGRRMSTREVTSVTEDVRLNKALWTLAESMANLL